ncbi:hypothetical protein KR009_009473, partial [Drosophila setifemur]
PMDQRRRFRNKRREEHSVPAPVTIARRSDDPRLVQPKILLKKDCDRDKERHRERDRDWDRDRDRPVVREKDKDKDKNPEHPSSGSSNQETPSSMKTIIVNRTNDARVDPRCLISTGGAVCSPASPHLAHVPVPSSSVCAALVSSAPNYSARDKSCNPSAGGGGAVTGASTAGGGATPALQDLQPPRMTRPTPLIAANGVFNANARKLFHKTNTDFTVIGVLGSQCSGKSTLLNLLTAERSLDYDYYHHLFSPESDECIFANRHKNKPNGANQKSVLRPRTENLQFFITRERHILLDTPPLLGSTTKEPDQLDLQSMGAMAQMLGVCHVLILVIDGVSIEQLRLLNAALRLRPRFPCKGYVRDHLPQVLLVRNRLQRHDFEPQQRERMDKLLSHLYGPTGLPIYRGRGEARSLNTFLMPEVTANGPTAYHAGLGELVRQFKERVLGCTRVSMCQASSELSEALWFELLVESARKVGPHFEKIQAEIKLRHLDTRSQWWADNWR